MASATDNTPSSEATLDTLLTGYLAGSLPPPVQVLVEAHLELNPESRRWASCLETVGGEVLDRLDPVAPRGRDAKLDAIFALDADPSPDATLGSPVALPTGIGPSGLPASIERYVGRSLSDVPWRTRLPGIREWKARSEDGYVASLFCLRAGHGLPPHTHRGTEMTLVLHGSFTDTTGRYGAGDISIADDEIDHRPVADPGGDCIGFVVTNAGLRLTGRIGRLLAPFTRQ